MVQFQEGGRGINNKYAEDGTLRRMEIHAWSTADNNREGEGTIKVVAKYKKDEEGVWVNTGEGLEVPITYSISEDGNEGTIVLGGFITEMWTRSNRSIVDPESATAVPNRSWGEIKGTIRGERGTAGRGLLITIPS